MVSPNRLAIASILLFLLPGCFISPDPLIEAETAVLPIDGDMTVCPTPDDDCLTLDRHQDGYLVESPEGEALLVRFAPLIQAGGRQVFIAEAGVRTEDGTGYIYGLARRMPAPGPRGATMQVAALDCEDIDEAARETFMTEGGEIGTGKVTECRPVSLDQLKAVLLSAHRAGLGEDAWWQAQAEEF